MAVRAMGSGAPISIGNPSSQPNASINVKQAVNGSPAVVIQRNTDSGPSGTLFSVINAVASPLAYIDVFGGIFSNDILQGPTLTTTGAATAVSAGQISIGATTATSATAGANGAVPAQVAGYIIINVAGTAMKIPYFNT